MSRRVIASVGLCCVLLMIAVSLRSQDEYLNQFQTTIRFLGSTETPILEERTINVDPTDDENSETKLTSRLSSSTFFEIASHDSFQLIQHEEIKQQSIRQDKIQQNNNQSLFDKKKWRIANPGGLQNEDRTLLASIYEKATSVFEYGLGESTYIANAVHVARYAGIDSDVVWVDQTRKNVNNSHFRFYYGDTGSVRSWGYPQDRSLAKIQYQYQVAPLMAELLPFDVYMVDGRYRVACVLLSFLHASARSGGTSDPIVLLHDCWKKEYSPPNAPRFRRRAAYNILDNLFTLSDHSRKFLCAYKRNKNTTDDVIYQTWLQVRNDPE